VYRQLVARRSFHAYIPQWIQVTDDIFRIKDDLTDSDDNSEGRKDID
jgi:hypothetical protein